MGIGLVFGLTFATAFYLVGFGEYVVQILVEAGVAETSGIAIGPVGVVSAAGVVLSVALTVLSVFGTENTESLQNAVVGVLLAILVSFCR